MQPLANVHGVIGPLAEVRISAMDRGFLFGDAVYEVLRVYHGKPWLEAEHFKRLEHSLASIRITGVDIARLRRRMHETIAAGPFGEATCYMQITRGAAPRAHAFPANTQPLEFLFVQEFKDPYVEARQHGTAVVLAPDIRWERCDIKSTNLLGNVLAMQTAKESGCSEALLYLADGTLTEGTHSSLFGVLDGAIHTAPKTNAILPGMTRDFVLQLARELNFPIVERNITRDQLNRVSELFLTGTTTEVLPITKVAGTPIANGQVGPVVRALQVRYAEAVKKFLGG